MHNDGTANLSTINLVWKIKLIYSTVYIHLRILAKGCFIARFKKHHHKYSPLSDGVCVDIVAYVLQMVRNNFWPTGETPDCIASINRCFSSMLLFARVLSWK